MHCAFVYVVFAFSTAVHTDTKGLSGVKLSQNLRRALLHRARRIRATALLTGAKVFAVKPVIGICLVNQIERLPFSRDRIAGWRRGILG